MRSCYTDFHLATKINFLSGGSGDLLGEAGPDHDRVLLPLPGGGGGRAGRGAGRGEQAAADKLERRLERLGVTYERRDLMKPVLLRLSRKVEPEELFPDRSLPRCAETALSSPPRPSTRR